MKTGRKVLALALCVILALGCAVTAFAAGAANPKDIAKEFMALLKADGVKYDDVGLDDDGRYEIDIHYEGTNVEEHYVVLKIDDDGQDFGLYEWYLMDYEEDRLVEVLKTVNNLNLNYRHVTFLADTTDNTITAKTFGSLQGTAKQCAEQLHYAYDWLPIMVDRLWPVLEAGVLGTGMDPEDANFCDTWYFSSITATEDFSDAPAGTTVTAEELGVEYFVATFHKNGTAVLISEGDEDDALELEWEQDGINATLFDEDEGAIPVTMTDKDTIILDLTDVAGYILTLVRKGSNAYKALL